MNLKTIFSSAAAGAIGGFLSQAGIALLGYEPAYITGTGIGMASLFALAQATALVKSKAPGTTRLTAAFVAAAIGVTGAVAGAKTAVKISDSLPLRWTYTWPEQTVFNTAKNIGVMGGMLASGAIFMQLGRRTRPKLEV